MKTTHLLALAATAITFVSCEEPGDVIDGHARVQRFVPPAPVAAPLPKPAPAPEPPAAKAPEEPQAEPPAPEPVVTAQEVKQPEAEIKKPTTKKRSSFFSQNQPVAPKLEVKEEPPAPRKEEPKSEPEVKKPEAAPVVSQKQPELPKPEMKAEAPAPKSEVKKPEPKPEVKKQEAAPVVSQKQPELPKPEVKPASKPEVKVEAPAPKPEVKVTPKPEVKAETPAPKPEPKKSAAKSLVSQKQPASASSAPAPRRSSIFKRRSRQQPNYLPTEALPAAEIPSHLLAPDDIVMPGQNRNGRRR